MSEDMFEVPGSRLRELSEDSRMLAALYEAGVDNWEGYSEARRIFRGDDDE